MKLLKLFVVAALAMGDLRLSACELCVIYTAELQTDYRDCNFANLLELGFEVPFSSSVSASVSSFSIAKTRNERLINDFQTFSNIEEDNLPFALAVCGLNWKTDRQHLFLGIRNVNEDYFTSDLTSFYTNSSCGIYPTISSNFPIANYPVASVGMHYKAEWHLGSSRHDSTNTLVFQSSLYNGLANNCFSGSESVFRCNPKKDGVFALAEAQYQYGGTQTFLGTAFYCKGGVSVVPWLYVEQSLSSHLCLLAGCSYAFASEADCKNFFGLGTRYQLKKTEWGVFTDYACFNMGDEWATELTCKYSFPNGVYLQPVVHLVVTDSHFTSVGGLRLGIVY